MYSLTAGLTRNIQYSKQSMTFGTCLLLLREVLANSIPFDCIRHNDTLTVSHVTNAHDERKMCDFIHLLDR